MMATKQMFAGYGLCDQNFAPTAPPSYSEAVSEESAGQQIATNYSLFSLPSTYAPPVSQPSTTNAKIVTVPVFVGPNSARVQCPGCHNSVITEIKSVSQKSAHIACLILCLIGCCLCSCIPFCMKTFQNVHHYCPECKTFIGTYKN